MSRGATYSRPCQPPVATSCNRCQPAQPLFTPFASSDLFGPPCASLCLYVPPRGSLPHWSQVPRFSSRYPLSSDPTRLILPRPRRYGYPSHAYPILGVQLSQRNLLRSCSCIPGPRSQLPSQFSVPRSQPAPPQSQPVASLKIPAATPKTPVTSLKTPVALPKVPSLLRKFSEQSPGAKTFSERDVRCQPVTSSLPTSSFCSLLIVLGLLSSVHRPRFNTPGLMSSVYCPRFSDTPFQSSDPSPQRSSCVRGCSRPRSGLL